MHFKTEMATPFLGIESNRAFASVAYIHTYIHTSIHKPLAYLGKYKYRLIAWNRYVSIRSVSIRFDPMRCEPIATSVGTSSGFAICLFSFATGAGAVARSRDVWIYSG